MALASLKKLAPPAKRARVSVDEFIDGASRYALGQAEIVPLPLSKDQPIVEETLKRATFTLGDTAIQQLNKLSASTGIAKSRLIRIWLAKANIANIDSYLTSSIK